MGATRRVVPVAVLFIAVMFPTGAGAALGADWPNYRGPNHNGLTSETDWNCDWGESGPKVLWKASVGIGFSCTAVADGRVYTMGNTGKDSNTDIVHCLDAKTGKEIWQHSYPCQLLPKYYEGGTLSSPTVDDGKVYTLSKVGDLLCLDATTGNVIWHKRLNKDMGFELPTWHFSSSPLILDDMLILDVGTAGLALNKKTGELIWQNGKGKCGYSTAVPFAMGGRNGLAIFGEVTLLAVSPTDGKKLWEFPWKTRYEVNAPDPIITGNRVFISSGYGRGCALLEINGGDVKKVWESKVMAMQINCPVLRDEYVYGFDEKVFKCIKLADGSEQWHDKSLGKGSLIMSADGRLVIMSDKGELVIAKADPRKFNVLARARILPEAKCWTAPVLSNGRIYARNTPGDFVCVDVRGAGK